MARKPSAWVGVRRDRVDKRMISANHRVPLQVSCLGNADVS